MTKKWLAIMNHSEKYGTRRGTSLLLLLTFAHSGTAASLCTSSERATFSCALKNGKTVSICRSVNKHPDVLTYRFGDQDKVELEFSDRTGPTSRFRYEHYFRYKRDYFDLSFQNDDHTYTVFRERDEGQPEPESGLIVQFPPGGRHPLRLACTSNVGNDDFARTTDVSCDKEELFGCDE